MEKVRFTKSEVISYIEDKILMNEATEDEANLYNNFKWNGILKNNFTYKKLVKEMKAIYEYGF